MPSFVRTQSSSSQGPVATASSSGSGVTFAPLSANFKRRSSPVRRSPPRAARPAWVRDVTLDLPAKVPFGLDLPIVEVLKNTVRGQHFTIFRGEPKLIDGRMWMAAPIPADDETRQKLASFMLKQISKELFQYSPTRVNSAFMTYEKEDGTNLLVCVVSFR
mmetsp:Transcript_27870/g.69877  ORF Transcript_27870/g.69877 Transcript_27870/m.69877 type:complete len:161 (-) Transcript_27870:211-693(-)|eukprot:CAMPEP_0177656232 /NCGR_PEP_ID=MMETSP0447-20121125/15435_1 /TAXON_ID=0 /ORGANISM="Stygamoeba regulata, Strain BSH-02190019" /LENGTH=160 /DNA_ID=CAMNT_0019160293 /DNA_START=59 /DNA_END=541 /DNA_ORIENTATION=+